MDSEWGNRQSAIGSRGSRPGSLDEVPCLKRTVSRLPAACRRPPRSRGFTLIEVLVALVIFGIITVALSFTFDTALKTQQANIRRLAELGAIRSVFDYMTRDVQQAYASSNNPAAVFIAGGSQNGASTGSSALLTLMTRGNRLLSDAPAGSGGASGPLSTDASLPQSETAMVRYEFDPQARTLSRVVATVPSLQALQQAVAGPDTVVSALIEDISLRFWDTTTQAWRAEWDYEQQNQQPATPAAGTADTTGATAAASATSAVTSGTGDTTLPGSVEVTITIRHPDRTTATYVTTIPVVASQVADGMAPPANTGANATTAGATGAGAPQ